MDALLVPQDGDRLSDFSRLKQAPRKPSLKQIYLWIKRLDWLISLMDTTSLLQNIAHTKVRQFAAEASVMEAQDFLDIRNLPNSEGYPVTPKLIEHLSPYIREQTKRFGQYVLDMEEIPEALQFQKLQFT